MLFQPGHSRESRAESTSTVHLIGNRQKFLWSNAVRAQRGKDHLGNSACWGNLCKGIWEHNRRLFWTLGSHVQGFTSCAHVQVALANDGRIFVADGYCNNRVAQFTAEGKHVGDFLVPGEVDFSAQTIHFWIPLVWYSSLLPIILHMRCIISVLQGIIHSRRAFCMMAQIGKHKDEHKGMIWTKTKAGKSPAGPGGAAQRGAGRVQKRNLCGCPRDVASAAI